MATGPDRDPAASGPSALAPVRERADAILASFLADRRAELADLDPSAGTLVSEIERLLRAGGKRIRPAFCYWGFRVAGGEDGGSGDEPILRVAAALELLHTFALVHDDVMDGALERRGVPSTSVHLAEMLGTLPRADDAPEVGVSAAILVGDLAMVLADRLFLSSGFAPERLLTAAARIDRMRVQMAAGQFLDVAAADRHAGSSPRVARLKTGSYTVEGPLEVGAILAGASPEQLVSLTSYAVPLGEAFQLRDDVMDGEAPSGSAAHVNRLITQSIGGLDERVLDAEAVGALRELAQLLTLGGA